VNPINFLIEENYAKSPEAAHKILKAASDEFYEYIMEATQAQYDRLQQKLATETDLQKRAELQAQINQVAGDQRQKILRPKKKRRRSKSNNLAKSAAKYALKKAVRSKAFKTVSNFVTKTALGGLVP
jgi:polyribonucleotide nucleotidyltransferase